MNIEDYLDPENIYGFTKQTGANPEELYEEA